MSISIYPNPDTISIGEKAVLGIWITNNGSESIRINAVELKYPDWGRPINYNRIVEPEGTNFVEMEVQPRPETSSGKYVLEVLVSSTQGDKLATTTMSIERFDTIPLSGDLPLYLFVILFSGIIMYEILRLIAWGKIDMNYVQVGILGFGLGLISWLVLRFVAETFPIELFGGAH